MILINLLPPELRKRHGGISPMFVSVVGGGAVCLFLLVLWGYVQFVRLPNADAIIAQKSEELTVKTAEADKVLAIKAEIAKAKDRYNMVVGLMLQKVYWARTIDEFATLLNGAWTVPNFDVRCLDLTVTEGAVPGERRGGQAAEQVAFSFSWRYKLLGKERPLAGDYIKSFFDTIKQSRFWREQGFVGKPEESYLGDQPRMNTQISRVVIEGNLMWQRVKTVPKAGR
jgi:hypothetical protein